VTLFFVNQIYISSNIQTGQTAADCYIECVWYGTQQVTQFCNAGNNDINIDVNSNTVIRALQDGTNR